MNESVFYDAVFPLSEYQADNVLWKVRKLFPVAASHLTRVSLEKIVNEKRLWARFEKALTYVNENIDGDYDVLGLGLLSNEIQILLFRSIYLSSVSFYKEAFYDLRSALEISLFLSSEYVLEGKSTEEQDFFAAFEKRRRDVSDWLSSKRRTPMQDKLRKILSGQRLFKKLFVETKFEEHLKTLGLELNSYVHTNGMRYTNFHIHRDSADSSNPPTLNPAVLNTYMARFVDTTSLIAIMTVATRPQLLDEALAVRLYEAMSEIPSGLWGRGAKNFFDLVPTSYGDFFKEYWIKAE